MIKVTATRLWQGGLVDAPGEYVTLRDCLVKQAINNGGMEITLHIAGRLSRLSIPSQWNNKTMQLKPEELQDLKPNSKVYQNKLNGIVSIYDTNGNITSSARRELTTDGTRLSMTDQNGSYKLIDILFKPQEI